MATKATQGPQRYYSPPRQYEPRRQDVRSSRQSYPEDGYAQAAYPKAYAENGVMRTASGRRRESMEEPVDIPAAPEAPRISRDRPPAAYRPPYDAYDSRPHPSSKSFAARATAMAQMDAGHPQQYPYSDVPVDLARSQPRRSSDGQAVRMSYPTDQQPARRAYVSGGDAPPRRAVSGSERRSAGRSIDRPGDAVVAPRAADIRPLPRVANDWAADRSPLQRLEVKLNDISKEEKRARVAEAEQRLREKRASQGLDSRPARTDSRRIVSEPKAAPPPQRYREAPVSGALDPATRDAAARRNFSGPPEGARRSQGPPIAGVAEASPRGSKEIKRTSMSTRSADGSRIRRSLESGRSDDRAVRFHSEEGPEEIPAKLPQANRLSKANKEPPPRVSSEKQPRSSGVPDVEKRAVAQRPPEAHTHAHEGPDHLKHQLPPQTAAGKRARQQVGFGMAVDDPAASPEERHHHMPHLFHRHRAEPTGGRLDTVAALDEWKQGGVAHLKLEDALAAPQTSPKVDRHKPWEKGRSSKRRSAQEAEVTLFDGAQEDGSGMVPRISLKHRETSLATAANMNGPVRARQYIGYEGTSKPRRRNRAWLRSPKSILKLRFTSDVPSALTFSYSYACAILSEHAPFHTDHICTPYMTRELMRTMRAIRVRAPTEPTMFSPPLLLKCGPLLRYTGIKRETASDGEPTRETWRGSVMIVTTDQESVYEPAPTLRLYHQPMDLLPPPPTHVDEENEEDLPSEYVDPIAGLPKMTRTGGTVWVKPAEDLDPGVDVSAIDNDDGLFEAVRTANVPSDYGRVGSELGGQPKNKAGAPRLGRFREVKGIRLHKERGVTFWRFNLEVELGDEQTRVAYRINRGTSIGFWVPSRNQTMNIMFHSCNGFSMSVDPNTFSGPDPLWRDVLNTHQMQPFHVMIGGGDQIYNDCVVKQTRLFQEWIEHKRPHEKHEAEFTAEMQEELETFYLERYSMWFSQGLFGMANSQIPMVNIWDDHDIIDGYGSYPDSFMTSPVFCGLGNIAYKYYMLFQHQTVDAETEAHEASWILGAGPGPYISALSRSVFMWLGRRVAFLGLDCRTERTRDEVLSEHSYELILERCRRELVRGETHHLIVLLGVPIAYPRLVWLENILTSRALDPLKALGRMGLLGNVMNKFDGGVEVLDDLDDHWTAKNHKEERNWFIEELQDLAAEKSVRITILGGDVHLAAVGQFYSNKTLKIPKDKDHRYMPNVISSAIVNTPPPDMMADVLNKRNKIHHLNRDTDEEMIPMFTHDVDGKPRNNKRLLPKRNWCSITEYVPGSTPPATPSTLTPTESEESLPPPPEKPASGIRRTLSLGKGDSKPAKLIRRLSLGAKPASQDEDESERSITPPQERPRPHGEHPAASRSDQPQGGAQSGGPPPRPGNFQRRPTTLEVAAKKGGGEDVGAGHINLEWGLDIKLNCEIKQGDPSGSTEPYRLLVPALFFADTVGPEFRPNTTLVRRLTGGMKIGTPKKEEFSESGSETGTDDELDHEPGTEQLERASTAPQPKTKTGTGLGIFRMPMRGNSLLRKKNPRADTMPAPGPPRDLEPFKPRPRISLPIQGGGAAAAAAGTRDAGPTAPSSAPATQSSYPRAPDSAPARFSQPPPAGQRGGVAVRSGGGGGGGGGKYYDGAADDDMSDDISDEDDDDSLDDLEPTPRRRVAGKFDRTGASKFYGDDDPATQQAQAARRGGAAGNKRASYPSAAAQKTPDRRVPLDPDDEADSEDDEHGYDGIEAYKEKKGWRRFLSGAGGAGKRLSRGEVRRLSRGEGTGAR